MPGALRAGAGHDALRAPALPQVPPGPRGPRWSRAQGEGQIRSDYISSSHTRLIRCLTLKEGHLLHGRHKEAFPCTRILSTGSRTCKGCVEKGSREVENTEAPNACFHGRGQCSHTARLRHHEPAMLNALTCQGSAMHVVQNSAEIRLLACTRHTVPPGSERHCLHVQATRYVHCPTCRQKAPVADIAFVDAGRTAAKEAGASSSKQHEEEGLYVRGSYSTKVCIITTSSTNFNGVSTISEVQGRQSRPPVFLLAQISPREGFWPHRSGPFAERTVRRRCSITFRGFTRA